MRLEFTVHGEPVGKGRPRFARNGDQVRTYTPDKTVSYETWVRTEYVIQCKDKAFDNKAQVGVEIRAYYGIPKSASKKRQVLMLDGKIRPTKKPDADNIIKAICDALNGVVYWDDAQIVSCCVRKYYGSEPRTEVTMYDING